MDEVVSQTNRAVTEVKNLAQSLQEGAGPQIDLALNEAQVLMDYIVQSLPNMTEKSDESKNALQKSFELHDKMARISIPLETPNENLKSLKSGIKKFKDDITDIRKYSDISKEKAAQTAFINDANRYTDIFINAINIYYNIFHYVKMNKLIIFIHFSRESLIKQNERINSLTKLKETADDALDDLMKTIKEASDDLGNSTDAFAKIGTDNESMKATKAKVDSVIEKEARVIEELRNGLSKAKEHSDKLNEQVWLFT